MTDQYADPPRMFETEAVPRELRQWLTLANEDGLSASQLDRLVSSFEQRLQTADITSARVPGIKAWLRTSAGKLSVVVAVLGLGAAGTLAIVEKTTRTVEQTSQPEVSSVPESKVVLLTPRSEPLPSAPNVHPLSERPPAVANTAVVAEPRAAEPLRSARPSTASGPRLGEPNAEAADEYRLIRAARQAAASDAAQALALTDEHLRRFPRGMLSQERETIAIEALARLGNRAAARQRAQRFLANNPSSPYAGRIQSAVAP